MFDKAAYFEKLKKDHSITSICVQSSEKFNKTERLFCFVVSKLANSAIGAYFGYTIWRPDPDNGAASGIIIGLIITTVWDTIVFEWPIQKILSRNLKGCWNRFAYIWGSIIIFAAVGFVLQMLGNGCNGECSMQSTFTNSSRYNYDGTTQWTIPYVNKTWPFRGSEAATCEFMASNEIL